MTIEKQFFAVEQMPHCGPKNTSFTSKTEFDISLKTNHSTKVLREHKFASRTYFVFGDVLAAIWDDDTSTGAIFK